MGLVLRSVFFSSSSTWKTPLRGPEGVPLVKFQKCTYNPPSIKEKIFKKPKIRGRRVPKFLFRLETAYFYDLEAHAKLHWPTTKSLYSHHHYDNQNHNKPTKKITCGQLRKLIWKMYRCGRDKTERRRILNCPPPLQVRKERYFQLIHQG